MRFYCYSISKFLCIFSAWIWRGQSKLWQWHPILEWRERHHKALLTHQKFTLYMTHWWSGWRRSPKGPCAHVRPIWKLSRCEAVFQSYTHNMNININLIVFYKNIGKRTFNGWVFTRVMGLYANVFGTAINWTF